MGAKAEGSSNARAKGRVSAAKQMIEQAKARASGTPPLNALALEHLQELIEYNDSVSGTSGRVSIAEACNSLQTFGWKGGRDALNAVCRAQLGRKSFGTKA